MRDYQQVVSERYEHDDFTGKGILSNIYSCINPIGNEDNIVTIQVMRKYLRQVMESSGKTINEIKILDCGCGNGNTTRMISNLIGNTENVYGFEFSDNRLNFCKKMNPAIHYERGDLVRDIPFKDIQFDGIIARDVLSHIRREDDLYKAIKNIFDRLQEKGVFLWFEINAKVYIGDRIERYRFLWIVQTVFKGGVFYVFV